MSLHRIQDVHELKRYLHAALQLEHATIPPYLTALYSIHPGTNTDAYHVIRVVLVEEMLHLTLVANLLNAVGGRPDLTEQDFVPSYPAYLPNGETDFQVHCERFSESAVKTFLQIERPEPPSLLEGAQTKLRTDKPYSLRAASVADESEEHFYSIGAFYQAVQQGLETLHQQLGDDLFCGDPARQVTPAYYYSGGGDIIPVTDLDSAKAAIRLISEQGEGVGGGIYDYEGELSHYYRFEQLLLGRYYNTGDVAGTPTGAKLDVDWSAVYPLKKNARLADYEDPQLRAAAAGYNRFYAGFLGLLTRAFDGEPQLLIEAVGGMFRIKELTYQLMRQPIGDGVNAAPTFEMEEQAQ